MKKKSILALLLVLVMVAGLVAACGGGGGGPADTGTQPPATQPADIDDTDVQPDVFDFVDAVTGEQGMFDTEYDYSANPRFRVEYVLLGTSTIAEAWGRAFEQWAMHSNVEFLGMTEFGSDADAMMMSLPAIAARADGLIIEADQQMFNAIGDMLYDLGTPWMPGMGLPIDMEGGQNHFMHPYAGFNQLFIGEQLAIHLVDQAQALWPNIPLDEFGFIIVDFSVAYALHSRTRGARYWLEANHPEFFTDNRFFIADTSIAMWDLDTSNDVVTTVLATNPHIENWLIIGIVESMAQGAALAIDAFGYEDTTFIISFGAEAARVMWDAGQSSAWRAAGSSAFMVVTEPIFFGLYAMMMGEVAPNDIWLEWVDCASGQRFPSRLVPFFFVNQENYRRVFAWSDVYAGADLFPQYAAERELVDRYTFSARIAVPEVFRCNQPGCRFCEAARELQG